MREHGIVGYRRHRWVRTTIPEPSDQKVPDLLNRDFTAPGPNQRYVGDITYLPLSDGENLYLATVIDCYSQEPGLRPQVVPVRLRRVRLVGQHPVRTSPRPPRPEPIDTDHAEHGLEGDRVMPLTLTGEDSDRPAGLVRGEMDLGGQPAARPGQRLPEPSIPLPSGQILVVRSCPL